MKKPEKIVETKHEISITKPGKTDFAQLRNQQAAQFARDKEAGIKDAGEWNEAEFLSLDEMREKFLPARKKPVSLRLDADILEWLKSGGNGYQTFINLLFHLIKDGRIAFVESDPKAMTPRAVIPWPLAILKKEAR